MRKLLLVSLLLLVLTGCSNKPSQQEDVKLSDIIKNEETFIFKVDVSRNKEDEKIKNTDAMFTTSPIVQFYHVKDSKITSYNVPELGTDDEGFEEYRTGTTNNFDINSKDFAESTLKYAKQLDKEHHEETQSNYSFEESTGRGNQDFINAVNDFKYSKPKPHEAEVRLLTKDAKKLKKTSDPSLVTGENLIVYTRFFHIDEDLDEINVQYNTQDEFYLNFDKDNKPKLIKVKNNQGKDNYYLAFYSEGDTYAELLPVSKNFKKLKFDTPEDIKSDIVNIN